jgi:hypothetical protein
MLRTFARKPRLAGIVALAVLASLAAPASASAQTFGMITISNPTRMTVNYQVKWGDGDWDNSSVRPGHYLNHWYPLDANGQAPTPSIRFNYILNDPDVTYRSYRLGLYASRSRGYFQGKIYVFQVSGCGCYLDLKAN